jgi:general secretion pathway protein G
MPSPCRFWFDMDESGWNSTYGQRGFTLIELLVTLVIMFILASVALPFTKVSTKRAEELQLRQTLRTLRMAIDDFRRDWARDGGTLMGPLCVKNQLTCKEETGVTGYPKTLESLLKVELTGEEAQMDDKAKIRRYLRRIPLDPMTDTQEWGLRCYQDDPDETRWCGEDVFDVFTTSKGTGINGIPYREW